MFTRVLEEAIKLNIVSVSLIMLFLLYLFSFVFLRGYAFSQLNALAGVSRDEFCDFIESLFRDLGGFGCCVESPIVEPDVCYTSTNLLAEYVLRNICNRSNIADKIRAFLEKYPADFYGYYQVLLGKPIVKPFTTIEYIEVDVVNGIRIVHVARSNTTIEDYHRYADLVVYSALYHAVRGEIGEAGRELEELNKLFDGYGFADAYYEVHGKYEVYKIALAVVAYKALGFTVEAEKYKDVLFSIKPLATLYEHGFKGIGDLNLETASLVALALYSDIHSNIVPGGKHTTSTWVYPGAVTLVMVVTAILLVVVITLRVLAKRSKY